MKRKVFRVSVVLWLLIGMAWQAPQGRAEEQRYQERTLAQWQGDLKDPSPEVRRKAIDALAHFGPVAVPALAQALSDVDAQMRQTAAWVLGEMSPPAKEAVPALAQALEDLNVQVRQTAAWALGRFGPAAKEAVPQLTRALKDSGPVVRGNAAQALGAIGPEAKDAAVALAEAAWDGHTYVRESARHALERIGPAAMAELRRQVERDPGLQPLLDATIHAVKIQ